jgi:hypothetical protein
VPNLIQEYKHLVLANRHIEEAEERICKQMDRKADLEAAGRDTTQSDRLLALFIETLDLMHSHRTQILAAMNEEETRLIALSKQVL